MSRKSEFVEARQQAAAIENFLRRLGDARTIFDRALEAEAELAALKQDIAVADDRKKQAEAAASEAEDRSRQRISEADKAAQEARGRQVAAEQEAANAIAQHKQRAEQVRLKSEEDIASAREYEQQVADELRQNLGVLRDEIERAEQALAEARERHRAFIQSLQGDPHDGTTTRS